MLVKVKQGYQTIALITPYPP